MSKRRSTEGLARELRRIYQSKDPDAKRLMEHYLEGETHGMDPAGKVAMLDGLLQEFGPPPTGGVVYERTRSDEITRLFSMLLGDRIAGVDINSLEAVEKLAQSINTIFDSLNEIMGVINNVLLGSEDQLETVRHFIGSNVEGTAPSGSLEEYLAQIKGAFMIAHQAFKNAAQNKMGEILAELDPENISRQAKGGLKFGAFLKSEYFEIYEHRFDLIKRWFESERFMEDVLREFEKNCRLLHSQRGGQSEKRA